MIPQFPEFINIQDLSPAEYAKAIEVFEPYSDFNFTSLYVWSGPDGCGIATLNGNVVIDFRDYQTNTKFLSFMGNKETAETARILLEYVANTPGYDTSLYLVPEVTAASLIAEYEVTEDRDNHDYILSASHYVDLAGNEFANKRKNINKFHNRYGGRTKIQLLNIHDETVKTAVQQLVRKWFGFGSDGAKTARNEEAAIDKLLHKYAQLPGINPLYLIGLLIDDKLEGFCFFEKLPDDYAITHFGKANADFEKSYEYMMTETLRYIHEHLGVDLVNYEQDLGILGLRQNKLNHHPVKYLKKYNISLR